MKVEWTVQGDPDECKYWQDEIGSYLDFGRGIPPTLRYHGINHEASCSYLDPIGLGFFSPQMDGDWNISIYARFALRCESSGERGLCKKSILQSINFDASTTETWPPW